MKIFLIGMPGSGKTTFGKELASRLMVPFVDLDAEIEESEQSTIADVFSQRGEDYFRLVESRLLREWVASAGAFVMSTGGGAPCFHRGMEIINQSGISIFLDCPVAILLERVKKNSERPLLLTTDENELRERLERMRTERLDCYSQAKIVVGDVSVDVILERLGIRK